MEIASVDKGKIQEMKKEIIYHKTGSPNKTKQVN